MILIIAAVIVFILIIYFVFLQKREIPTETKDNKLILFNEPYEIYAQHLVDILRDLHLIADKEFDLVTTIYINVPYETLPQPLIPFESYFSIGNKICVVTKTEINTDKSISLVLHFSNQ